MARYKQGTAAELSIVSAVIRLFTEEKSRPVAIRYLAPIVTTLLTVLFACLPIIAFRTVGGESDMHSLFYWQNANFFGTDGTKGAYELLINASEGNQSAEFYRAVVITYIVFTIFFVLGIILTVLISGFALYLLATEEKTEQSRKAGRILRVALGGRMMTLVPRFLTVLPFAFSHLLAYYYTALLSYETSLVFAPFDPLIVAVLLFALDVILALYAAERERRAKYDVFRSPARRATEAQRKKEMDREWEEAVRADAEGKKSELRNDAKPLERSEAMPHFEKAEPKPMPKSLTADESLYGKEFLVGTAQPTDPEPKASEKKTESFAEAAESDERRVAEMRKTIEALFDPDVEEPLKHRKRNKK